MNKCAKCAKFHKDSPSGKKVKFNLARAIELSKTADFVYMYYPGQKNRYTRDIHEADQQCDHVISSFGSTSTRPAALRVASSPQVADRSRCRMISHDRTADQSHEYLGCNDFFGQGSTCIETLCKRPNAETLCKRPTSVAHLTNFSFEFFYEIFTEDASLPFLYHGAKKSKMTKNSNQRGGGVSGNCCCPEFALGSKLN